MIEFELTCSEGEGCVVYVWDSQLTKKVVVMPDEQIKIAQFLDKTLSLDGGPVERKVRQDQEALQGKLAKALPGAIRDSARRASLLESLQQVSA